METEDRPLVRDVRRSLGADDVEVFDRECRAARDEDHLVRVCHAWAASVALENAVRAV
jgi:hypothetical protein